MLTFFDSSDPVPGPKQNKGRGFMRSCRALYAACTTCLLLSLWACSSSQPGVLVVSNVSVKDGQNATFTAQVQGLRVISYQWIKNSQSMPGATGASFLLQDVTMSDDQSRIQVMVTHPGGITSSNTALLTVQPVPPSILEQPAIQSIFDGETATFSVSAKGTQPLQYQWLKNGAAIPEAHSASYTTPIVTMLEDGASFTVQVSNVAASITSDPALLVVKPVVPTQQNAPANQTVIDGQSATFTILAKGTAPLSYQWLKNGIAIPGASTSTLQTSPLTMADGGSVFSVVVSNVAGSFTSDPATLTVQPARISIRTQPLSQTAKEGQTATFQIIVTGTAPLQYQWSRNGVAIPGATAFGYTSPVLSLLDNGAIYSVKITNQVGSATSNNVTLTVNLAPPMLSTQPATQSAMDGSTATFQVLAAGSAPLMYQWNRNGSPIPGATNASYTTPTLGIGDDNSQYTVTVSNAVGQVTSGSALLTVKAVPPSITTHPLSQTILIGKTATFSAAATGSATLAYQWLRDSTPIAGATGTTYVTPPATASDQGSQFSIAVSNKAGTALSQIAILDIAKAPIITAQPIDRVVKEGEQVRFAVASSGTQPMTYRWWKNGVIIPGATSASYTIPIATMADHGGRYNVSVNNMAGGKTSLSVHLSVVEASPGIQIHELYSNDNEIFPRREALTLRSVERLSAGVGLRLNFQSDFPNFAGVQQLTSGTLLPNNAPGVVDIAFQDNHLPNPQVIETVFKAYGQSGNVSQDYPVQLNYYPSEFYAQYGQTTPGTLTLRQAALSFATTRVEDWVPGSPTPEDIAFAQATWGSVIAGLTSPTEQARAIGKSIIDALEPYRGAPSDKMNQLFQSPFEQYRLALTGTDPIWCTQIAGVVSHACNSLGIPARTIGMGRFLSTGDDYDLMASEGHATTEIFDAQLNRWVWMDFTLYLLGMERTGSGLLNTRELQQCVNDSSKIDDLTVFEYSPLTRAMAQRPLLASDSLASIQRFFKSTTTLSTWKQGAQLPSEAYSNEADLFPSRHNLAIKSIDRLPQGRAGITLQLVSDMKDLVTFECTQMYASEGVILNPIQDSSGVFTLEFDNPHLNTMRAKSYIFRAIGGQGRASQDYLLTFYFYSKEFYALQGLTTVGQLILDTNDIPYAASQVEDWIIDQSTADDIRFAQATWGSLLDPASPSASAQAIARAILDALQNHGGVPSDQMRTTPFEQYRRAVAGLDRVGSTNLSAIFSHACNSLGIPSRIIGMGNVLSQGMDYTLVAVEGHAAIEIFDDILNRWVWMDPSLGQIGMEMDSYGLLSTTELQRTVSDAQRITSLTALEYDPLTQIMTRRPLLASQKLQKIQRLYHRDQKIRCTKKIAP